jgi:hypothetical protein
MAGEPNNDRPLEAQQMVSKQLCKIQPKQQAKFIQPMSLFQMSFIALRQPNEIQPSPSKKQKHH